MTKRRFEQITQEKANTCVGFLFSWSADATSLLARARERFLHGAWQGQALPLRSYCRKLAWRERSGTPCGCQAARAKMNHTPNLPTFFIRRLRHLNLNLRHRLILRRIKWRQTRLRHAQCREVRLRRLQTPMIR